VAQWRKKICVEGKMALRAISSVSSISLDSDVQPKNHHYGISAFLCVSGHGHYEKRMRSTSIFFVFGLPYMGSVISSLRRCKVPEMYGRITRERLNRFRWNFLRVFPWQHLVEFSKFGGAPTRGRNCWGSKNFGTPNFSRPPEELRSSKSMSV
jgi:hypothetical protein